MNPQRPSLQLHEQGVMTLQHLICACMSRVSWPTTGNGSVTTSIVPKAHFDEILTWCCEALIACLGLGGSPPRALQACRDQK